MDAWDKALFREEGITESAPPIPQVEVIVVYELNDTDQTFILRESMPCRDNTYSLCQ